MNDPTRTSDAAAAENVQVSPWCTFGLPPTFHELPLAADPNERDDQLRAFIYEIQQEPLPAQQWEPVTGLLLAELTDQLADQDVVHASLTTATIDEHPSAAALTVAVRSLDYTDPQWPSSTP